MNDVLAARFASLADATDTADWLDVQRRVRRPRRRYAAIAAIAAAVVVVVATAVAADGGWVSSDREVTARTDTVVAGRTWHVSYSASTSQHAVFCLRASSSGEVPRSKCAEMGPGSPRLGPPLGGLKLSVPGGEIWAGAAVGYTRRVAITDTDGRVHAAQAVRPPKGTKTPFRYWMIALVGSSARSITSYGSNGRTITTKLP